MYKSLYTFLCESSSVDDTDKKLSAFKLFEDINLPPDADEKLMSENMTLVQFNFDLISGWMVDDPSSRPTKLNIVKIIKNPAGEEIGRSETPIELPPNMARFNIREKIVGVPVKGFGSYVFQVLIFHDGKRIGKAEYPYSVMKAPELNQAEKS